MSICLDVNLKNEYPLCAEYDDKTYCYDMKIGDSVLVINSNKVTHWRDKLECGENEYGLYIFLHWKIMKGFL